MATLQDYFYEVFRARLSEKSIDTGGLKRLADGCPTDSPLREVLLELPDKVSQMEMMGLVYHFYVDA